MERTWRIIQATVVLVLFNIIYPFGLIFDAIRDNYVRDVKEIWGDYLVAIEEDTDGQDNTDRR